ncbi:MAG: hypothetical protein ACFFCP_07600 [Promethearchaeota archaeon]
MKEITIKYWGHLGRQEERKYLCSDQKIDFTMRAAQKIDLREVSLCTDLVTLNLSDNMLQELDLSPLSGSQTISSINLENNHLVRLDLWPLVNCSSLTSINLSNNRLSNLDLTPVFLGAQLQLDSSVVTGADYILRFALTNTEIKERFLLVRPDNSPWTATPVIIWQKFEALSQLVSWAEIRRRILSIMKQTPRECWFSIQRGLMIGLAFEELSGYDGDPNDLLSTTSEDMDFKSARKAIFAKAIELLDTQIESGGSTLFLETERMKTTRASKLIPKIVEARKAEMDSTVVQTKGSISLMNSLWLSYYGFKILEALDIGTQHYGDELDKIRISLDELGFSLNTQEVSSLSNTNITYPIRSSQSLRTYVFNLIEGAYA